MIKTLLAALLSIFSVTPPDAVPPAKVSAPHPQEDKLSPVFASLVAAFQKLPEGPKSRILQEKSSLRTFLMVPSALEEGLVPCLEKAEILRPLFLSCKKELLALPSQERLHRVKIFLECLSEKAPAGLKKVHAPTF